MDKELSLQERLYHFTQGDDWAYIKRKLVDTMLDLQSIRNLTGKTPEELVQDIKARNTAVDILQEIIKDIEGQAQQYLDNQKHVSQEDEDYIYRGIRRAED